MDDIVSEVGNLFTQAQFGYVLARYVDRDHWRDRIAGLFPSKFIENFTDFNYSRCFSLYVSVSDIRAEVGTAEFSDYIIKNGFLDRVLIQISFTGNGASIGDPHRAGENLPVPGMRSRSLAGYSTRKRAATNPASARGRIARSAASCVRASSIT